MPVYVVDHRSGPPTASFERSGLVSVETDGSSADALPESIRSVADSITFGKVDALRTDRVPKGANAAITWLTGDCLLQGSAASIRHELRKLGRRCFVPTHLACIAELDLLAVEPRWRSGGQMKDYWSSAARISRSTSPTSQFAAVLQTANQPWAHLLKALLAEQTKPSAGIDALARLANDNRTPKQLSALAVRNLIVLLMKHKEFAKAEEVLGAALKNVPGYAELSYVGALLCLQQRKSAEALAHLERARAGGHNYIGSGGEGSYRTAWLLGKLAAEIGNQKVAFENFYQGMVNQPVFLPAVDELLNLRLSPALVEKYQYDFCRLVRREPSYLTAVFDYLLLHRALSAARRIATTTGLAESEQDVLLQKLTSVETSFRPETKHDAKPGVMMSGPLFEHSSFGRINREIAATLMRSPEFDTALEPCSHPVVPAGMLPNGALLAKGLLRHPKQLDLTIRHHWPPDFQCPSRGKLASIVPWEYGAVPRIWVREIEKSVDELWVPADFVRRVFVQAGVSEDRVHVIPNGIDPILFSPDGPISRPHGCREFMFLFVGAAIQRKGIDVLLEAYGEAFQPGDDVTLVVSTGANPAYAHNSLYPLLARFADDPRRPHLAVVSEQLDDVTLATLYRGSNAFVLPYRGEGFGMPIAEAMACGKPIIATAAGPALEFCSADCGYFVPAREAIVPEAPPPLGEFSGEFTWFEPDVSALARTLRQVYENRDEAAKRGRNAAKSIRRKHTWQHITAMYLERIAKLTGESAIVAGDAERPLDVAPEMEEEDACQKSLCP